MEPLTLIALGLMAAAAAARVTWKAIQGWIDANKVPAGTARILRRRLASGRYLIVAGVFTKSGQRITQRTWQAEEIDGEVERRLMEGGGYIVIET